MPARKSTPAARAAAPKRGTRAEQNAARSGELLAAAWAVFGERGYEATTIDEIAERAGYSRMPIYTLFGDKQGLFFEMWRRTVDALRQQLLGSFRPNAPLKRNLQQLADAIARNPVFERTEGSPVALLFVVQTIALSRADVAAKLEQLARELVEDVATALRQSKLERGEALLGDAETVAGHLVAYVSGLAILQFQSRQRLADFDHLAATFSGMTFK